MCVCVCVFNPQSQELSARFCFWSWCDDEWSSIVKYSLPPCKRAFFSSGPVPGLLSVFRRFMFRQKTHSYTVMCRLCRAFWRLSFIFKRVFRCNLMYVHYLKKASLLFVFFSPQMILNLSSTSTRLRTFHLQRSTGISTRSTPAKTTRVRDNLNSTEETILKPLCQ